MSKKYNKYRTFCLPKEMVDHLILSTYLSPLEDNKESEIIVGLAVINDILSKSNQMRNHDDNLHHCIPMDSRYLKVKYGNDYKIYIHWLIINQVIWRDFYYKGRTTHYYLQSIEAHNAYISSFAREEELDMRGLVDTYCVQEGIDITLENLDVKGIDGVQKNRIYSQWYRIKVPVTKTNKRFLTKDYEEDAVRINNAPKHIKKMGSAFKNNLEIRYEDALLHSNNRYKKELLAAKTPDEEISAYKRYSSRISSINAINNGKINKSLRFRINSTNSRLDTNLTNMASDLRPFIVGYENMSYFDLSNSQPVLFNILLKKYREGASEKVIAELDKYLKITTDGLWYEELIRVFDISKYGNPETTSFATSRGTAKKTWMLLAYSKNSDLRGLKKRFAEEYPFVSSVITSVKKEKYEQFAIALQIIESEVFINEISKELVKVGIIPYTIHDGLLVAKEQGKQTLEIMSSVLKKHLGVEPLISVN
jgi:hypothetical protein